LENESDYTVVLKKTTRYWPIMLFPHHPKSNTIVFTGRETVRDVKFGVGSATLILTSRAVSCRLNVLRLLVLRVELSDILKVTRMDGKEGILEVHFKKAQEGFVTKMALSGEPDIPRGRILLNLGEDLDRWEQELLARTGLSK
jgi:hypothetical protein